MSQKFVPYDLVKAVNTIPEYGVVEGTFGIVVEVYWHSPDTWGYEIEFMYDNKQTMCVITVKESDIEIADEDE